MFGKVIVEVKFILFVDDQQQFVLCVVSLESRNVLEILLGLEIPLFSGSFKGCQFLQSLTLRQANWRPRRLATGTCCLCPVLPTDEWSSLASLSCGKPGTPMTT